MSNLEEKPAELACAQLGAPPVGQVLDARAVPLGGPRAMTVRRTLPQRARSLIGAWCFADHYGPDDVAATGGMRVDGHPHTGLQTVSWLFSGEIEHRDTIGTHALVRPGELNLMTAGRGIAHSEHSTAASTTLHGVQLWVALPERDRFAAPAFEHYVPEPLEHDRAQLMVFVGSLLGHSSPVTTFSPLVGAEITLPAGCSLRLPLNPGFEHGVLVDTGEVTVSGAFGQAGQLIVHAVGADFLVLKAGDSDARVLLLGGVPLGERLVMWWNFIGRSHDEIVEFRAQWQREREQSVDSSQFGRFPDEWAHTLPAPELPNARLRPRD
jgi:redox-sensitive bicupin YhaK (pirin superfamily)